MKEKIKVLIADDHELIRQGLERIVSFEEDLIVIFKAKNGEEVLSYLNRDIPDVLLLDINMPKMDGIEVLRRIKKEYGELKVIMLTVESDKATIFTAIDIGADGYILKDSAAEEIVDAIRTVYSGEKYIDKSLVSLLFKDIRNKEKEKNSIFDALSKREVEVLYYMSKGLSNKEIGDMLYLSEKTVKNYATSIFLKLNVHDRVQAAILALQNDIEGHFKF
ncbi:Transcriptional regulatory protein DegU [Caloramator mitchellensis]|uniref:Stage 0 sporulation protein A homolog n=1 Tax=Caloramator mitchellensis TaxID=908809 RepID=A0A0R3JZ75_CALMK|nr:response regulator transcription factor [Caloramator mitchellensis]KRQ86268.1 Transcriptional regulatory protein DegU [Caloramator mitchellensis]